MVRKNVQFEKTPNVTNIEFGEGKLIVSSCIFPADDPEDRGSAVLIKSNTGDAIPPGTYNQPSIISTEEFAPEVVIQFNNQAGLEVLQDYLNECRKVWNPRPDPSEYRGVRANYFYEKATDTHYGTLVNVNGSITFEGKDPFDFMENFHEAVDEYINNCYENNIPVHRQ